MHVDRMILECLHLCTFWIKMFSKPQEPLFVLFYVDWHPWIFKTSLQTVKWDSTPASGIDQPCGLSSTLPPGSLVCSLLLCLERWVQLCVLPLWSTFHYYRNGLRAACIVLYNFTCHLSFLSVSQGVKALAKLSRGKLWITPTFPAALVQGGAWRAGLSIGQFWM